MTFAETQPTATTSRVSVAAAFLGKAVIALVAIALLTAGALWFHLNPATVAPLYFLSIVLVAIYSGIWQAALVSVMAVLCQCYFFIPPLYSFEIEDKRNALALVVFECSVLFVSRLAAGLQRNTRAAIAQRRNTEMLYQLTLQTLQLDPRMEPGPSLLPLIQNTCALDAIALYDSALDTLYTQGAFPADAHEMARNTVYFAIDQDYGDVKLSRRVLRLGGAPIGALLLRGAVNQQVADGIASLVVGAFERHRAITLETQGLA